MVILSDIEAYIVARLLWQANDQLSNAGCNDFTVADTPAMREIVAKANQYCCGVSDEEARDIPCNEDKGVLHVSDFILAGYFAGNIEEKCLYKVKRGAE